MNEDATPILPAHIEETIAAIAQLQADHHERATPLERLTSRMTSAMARPGFIGVLTAVVIGWCGVNLAAPALGLHAFDPPPFAWLQGAVTLMALYATALILATQRREDELANYREQLTLELAILSEQKASKIIQLLEELRRDSPTLRDREDHQAAALAVPADPQAVLEALKDSRGAVPEA